MFGPYLRKHREKILPVCKDFSKGMDRYKKLDVQSLSFNDWFWLHPSAYKLMYYGTPSISASFYLVIGLWSWFVFDFKLIPIILFLLCLSSVRDFYRKYTVRHSIKGLSYYDLYLRDD